MSKLENANEFLGIRLEFNSGILLLDQESYILKLLQKFNMSECKSSVLPIDAKATVDEFRNAEMFKGPYRELVGSLLYLAQVTRPDILFAVNYFSQLQEHPTEVGWCG